MGSISRFSAIEKVVNAFELQIVDYFKDLVGMTVGRLHESDLEAEYWIGAYVPLNGSSKWEGVNVHFRWVTKEEFHSGVVKDEDIISDFNKFIAGNKITSISVAGLDRDDEVYLYANIDKYTSLEIPLGFNPETLEFYGFLEEIVSDENRKLFVEDYYRL